MLEAFRWRTPGGMQGIRKTISLMHALAKNGAPMVRLRALDIIEGARDDTERINKIFFYLKPRFVYVKDIAGMETLHSMEILLDKMAGDCDDMSVISAAFLLSIGVRVEYIAAAVRQECFNHVYVMAIDGKNRKKIIFDLTQKEPGREMENVRRRKAFYMTGKA